MLSLERHFLLRKSCKFQTIHTQLKWEWNISKLVHLKISLFTKCFSFVNTALALFNLELRSCMWVFQFKFPSTFISRYLKYFVLQRLFLYNFSFKSESQSFATFNAISFAFRQNESSFKSLFRLQWILEIAFWILTPIFMGFLGFRFEVGAGGE